VLIHPCLKSLSFLDSLAHDSKSSAIWWQGDGNANSVPELWGTTWCCYWSLRLPWKQKQLQNYSIEKLIYSFVWEILMYDILGNLYNIHGFAFFFFFFFCYLLFSHHPYKVSRLPVCPLCSFKDQSCLKSGILLVC